MVIVKTNLAAEECLKIQLMSLLQNFDCTFKVHLIFVEATFLAGITKSSFDAEREFPTSLWTIHISLKILKKVNET